MTRKPLAITIMVLFLIVSFAPVLTDSDGAGEGTSSNALGRQFESEWISISSPEELSLVGSGQTVSGKSYPADGKYYLTQNIDFTGKDLNGVIDIEIMITYDVDNREIRVKVGHKNGELEPSLASIYITLNDVVKNNVAGDYASFPYLTAPEKIKIGVHGIVKNAPGHVGESINFGIIDEFAFNGVSETLSMKDNGNMNPLSPYNSDSAKLFNGEFDGNGKKIIGLKTMAFASDLTYSGLFAYINGGMFNDVHLESGSSIAVSLSANARAGGLVGYAKEGIITDSCNTGNVSASSSSASAVFAGGLVGYANNGNVTIADSYNTGNVSASSSDAYVGGLVGYANRGSITITGSYNTGNVSAPSSTIAYAGGLVGCAFLNVMITGSYNTGDVSAPSTNVYAGGLVGYVYQDTTLTDSYNTGDVSTSSTNVCAGGLVGYTSNGNITITGSYNTGNVSASSDVYAGGLVGLAEKSITITGSYNTGNVSASSSASAVFAGGLVGYAKEGIITDSCNTGSVSALSSMVARAGGLVGYAEEGIITDSYNTGNVSASSSSSANVSAGGLVGCAYDGVTTTDSYNAGEIFINIGTYKGGIIGHMYEQYVQTNNRFITNCYFLEQTGLTLYGGTDVAVIDGGVSGRAQPSGPLSMEDLMDKDSYYNGPTTVDSAVVEGWDFNNKWSIDTRTLSPEMKINGGLPYLTASLITSHPSDVTAGIVHGNKFTVKSGLDLVTYQWQRSADGIHFEDIRGATNNVYITTAEDSFGYWYRCIVGTMESNAAQLIFDDSGTSGDDSGDNLMLFIAIGVVAAVVVVGAVYFRFLRKP